MKFDLLDFLKENQISFINEDLSKKSYIKIGFTAPTVYPEDENELTKLIIRLRGAGVEYKLLGAMSNVLLLGGERVYIKTDGINNTLFDGDSVYVGCGVRFSRLIKEAEKRGLSLLPSLIGIPGSVGGMIYSNAGAFGAQISDAVVSCRLFDTESMTEKELSSEEMNFGYRKSILSGGRYVLLSARFGAIKEECECIEKTIADAVKRRRETQPHGMPSLGSAFKRPEKDFAARLIDAAGLRGYRIGGAEISEKHAGFIVNVSCAEAEDVVRLIELAKRTVFEKFGVVLEEEIEILR